MGIPDGVAEYVGRLVTAPCEVSGYDSETAEPREFDDVFGYLDLHERRNEISLEAESQFSFLRGRGIGYQKAWLLHRAMDLAQRVREDFSPVDVLDRLGERFAEAEEDIRALEVTMRFVEENLRGLNEDLSSDRG